MPYYRSFSTQRSYWDHLLDIMAQLATTNEDRNNFDVWLTASTRDLSRMQKDGEAHTIYIEHGVGLQRHREKRLECLRKADLRLVPNELSQGELKTKMGLDSTIIGTPKLDRLVRIPKPEKLALCFSFHWTDSKSIHAYADAMSYLMAMGITVYGHAHPRIWDEMAQIYDSLDIQPLESFEQVVENATVYLCDHSSTLYEWMALGRPAVQLYRPNSQTKIGQSTGLLYQKYPIIQRMDPQTLQADIDWDYLALGSSKAVDDLYPYLGVATERACDVIRSYYEHE